MSLREDLEQVTMNQTKKYQEEGVNATNNRNTVETANKDILGDEESNPVKKNKVEFTNIKKVVAIITITVTVLSVLTYFIYSYITADSGAGFLQEMENEDIAPFQYTMEERELLRTNGYTGDDIERYEAEERNPSDLITEAKEARERLYDEEVKPYLDGASDKYKELESMTWLGTGEMHPIVLSGQDDIYEERYGTYNCDYIKVKPMGSQLFVKLHLLEFDEYLFMTVTPERYNKLDESGNIVVTIEYNRYENDSILVTNLYEKDIRD